MSEEETKASSTVSRATDSWRKIVLDNALDGVVGMDSDGRIIDWNHQAEVIFGWNSDHVLGQLLSDVIIPPEYREAHVRGLKHFLVTGEGPLLNHRIEVVGLHRNGTIFPLELTIIPVRVEGKSVFYSFVRNIVDRKTREDSLREAKLEAERIVLERTEELRRELNERKRSEEKLARLAERFERQARTFDTALSSSPDFSYIFDRNHRLIYVNSPLLKLWSKTLEEVVGLSFQELGYPPELVKLHEDQLNEVLQTGKPVKGESAYTNHEGKTGYYEYNFIPIFSGDGEVEAISGTTRDVTERKQAEEDRLNKQKLDLMLEQVKQSEELYRTLAESIPQLAWIAHADGFIYWYNRRWYDYTGTTPEQMEGWGWQAVHDPKILPKVLERWKESIETGAHFGMEFPIRGADGEFRWFLTRVTPVRDSAGKLVRWFGTNTDIDEQKKTQEALSAAIQSRDEFLSIASHELKTPITSLKLQLQMTKRRLPEVEGDLPGIVLKLKKAIEASTIQVDRLTALIEDLLDVSRIQSGKIGFTFEPFSVSEVVHEIIERFAEQLEAAMCPVELQIDPNLVGEWDRSRFEQVIVNLVSNCIKYAAGKPLKILAETRNGRARITIEDQGPGIPEDKQAKIFERFERATSSRNISGLGLGLFIVRRIVEGHSGTIRVESSEGKGTAFIIDLPIRPGSLDPSMSGVGVHDH